MESSDEAARPHFMSTIPPSPAPPFYPPAPNGGDSISLRGYVERIFADLTAAASQRWSDWIGLATQKWSDHQAVHSEDRNQLQRALADARLEIQNAAEAHRREHAIAAEGQIKADHTHQVQHTALNELRDVVGDLTSKYVPITSMHEITTSWDRRFADRSKEFDAYRDGTSKAFDNYRDGVSREQSTYRDNLVKDMQGARDRFAADLSASNLRLSGEISAVNTRMLNEIQALRESNAKGDGRGVGSREVVAYIFTAVAASGTLVAILTKLLSN